MTRNPFDRLNQFDHPADVIKVQQALAYMGYDATLTQADELWRVCSSKWCAQFLDTGSSLGETIEMLKRFKNEEFI